MSDRELLEFAAKAAGATWIDDSWPQDLPGLMLDFGNGTTQWNPLTDDGDALRLAVRLKMAIGHYGCGTCEVVSIEGSVRCDEFNDVDPYAATRRAIVRAAAEIGRNMT
jgi:hypothetical protein